MLHRHVGCFRCGYRLEGQVESWGASCPLRGRCPECGLDLEWGEVLSPSLRAPAWFVEGRGPILRSALATLLMTAAPWRFWRELRMSHTLRPWRLIAWLALLALLAWCLIAAGHGWAAARHHEALADNGATVTIHRLPYALHAAALPLSRRQLGRYALKRWRAPGLTQPMAEPRRLWTAYPDMLAPVAFSLLAVVVVFLACPAAFLVVPVSRRMCRVRPAHLVRITLYSLPLLLLMSADLYRQMIGGTRSLWLGAGTMTEPPMPPVTAGVYVAALFIWWGFATSRYLRMAHPWGVAAAFTVIAALMGWSVRAMFDLGYLLPG